MRRSGKIALAVLPVVGLALLCFAGARADDYENYDPGSAWWSPGGGELSFGDEDYIDDSGALGFVNGAGKIPTAGHPFFEAMSGGNGRACVSCHQPPQGMSIAALNVRNRWEESEGRDPIFAAIDGANCPNLPMAAAESHSLLLDRGLIRIALPPPKDAEFTIAIVKDPTGCNASRDYGLAAAQPMLSVYRRPRVVANFPRPAAGCGSTPVTADGREPGLKAQALTASLTHLQMKSPPAAAQLQAIMEFECQIYIAQSFDRAGYRMTGPGTPVELGPGNVRLEIANYLKAPAAAPFQSLAAWNVPGFEEEGDFRRSVARGAEIFSHRPFAISGAMGVNKSDQPVMGTCASCHDVAVTGAASARWIDTGSTNQPWAIPSPQLPLFKISCKASAPAHPFLGREIYTQDPGRALVTGKCADVGAIAVQQLRGLAARAPYFSNGSADSLNAVVDFYDRRFAAHFTDQEKQDLVNFLGVL